MSLVAAKVSGSTVIKEIELKELFARVAGTGFLSTRCSSAGLPDLPAGESLIRGPGAG
jgi:hypothetical protein